MISSLDKQRLSRKSVRKSVQTITYKAFPLIKAAVVEAKATRSLACVFTVQIVRFVAGDSK